VLGLLLLLPFGGWALILRPRPAEFTITFMFVQIGLSLLLGLFSYAILGGLYKMAIRHVRGFKPDIAEVFSAIPQAPSLIVAYLITAVLTFIGYLFASYRD
jgi:hypothetical protein